MPEVDVEMEGDGHGRESVLGAFAVTDERIVLKYLDDVSVSVTTIDLSSVDAVELSERPDRVRLTVDAGARTVSIRTADPRSRDEVTAARKTIRWFR